jgi:hypothetical protein
MYEIWLVLNIVWELALEAWPIVGTIGALWLVLMANAVRRRDVRWRPGLPLALAAGGVAAAVAFFALPGLTRSALGELRYWVDWLNLAGIALGVGAVAMAFAWPLTALRTR